MHFSQLILVQTTLGLNKYLFFPCYTLFSGSFCCHCRVMLVSQHQPTVSTPLQLFTVDTFISMCDVSLWDFCISFSHTQIDLMVMLSWSLVTRWCLYLPVHLVDKVMVKRVQERINKWSGVSCLKEYVEGAWRCEAEIEGKSKILFPRINLFPGSAKWLGILSCTLPRHGQCVSVCAGSGNTWVG